MRLEHQGNPVASCEYRTPGQPRQHWLEWPLDREDWDFGWFIARMIERQLEEPSLEAASVEAATAGTCALQPPHSARKKITLGDHRIMLIVDRRRGS
jgi:hypothetical protein